MEKLNRLIRPGCYRPQFKNGAALGAILGIATVGAVSQIGSSAGSALSDSLFDTSGRDFAAGQNELNRRWQSEEAQKNRDFQAQQQRQNQDWYSRQWLNQLIDEQENWFQQQDYLGNQSMDIWQQQQNYLNEYNTPGSQAKRLLQAGYNPALALGSQSTAQGMMAAPTAPGSGKSSVSMPSTPSGAMPSSGFSSAAQLPITSHSVNDLAMAYKNLQEGSKAKELVDARIRQLLSDSKNKESLTRINELDEAVKNSGLSAEKQAAAMRPFYEIRKLVADIQVSKALGGNYDADAALKKLQGIYQDAQNTMVSKKLVRYDELLANEVKLGIEEIKTEQSKQVSQYASAVSSYANAFASRAAGKTEDELRPLRVQNQKLQNSIASEIANGAHRENVIAEATKDGRIHLLVEAARRSDVITAREMVELEKAITDKEFQVLDKFVKYVDTGFAAYRNFGIGKNALTPSPGRSAFDPNAGNSFIMDDDTGLLFKAPWNK